MRRLADQIGQRYGRFVIVGEVDRAQRGMHRLMHVLCECGVTEIAYLSALRSGASSSCGCSRRPGFDTKVDRSGGENACWMWTDGRDRDGYGKFRFKGVSSRAHRVAWMLANGREIPEGMCVMHKCDNPPCVNPAHLSLGTNAENAADRDAKGRHWARRGADHGQAKLTDDHVREIRATGGTMLQREIAARFGITQVMVSRIIRRRAWTHI